MWIQLLEVVKALEPFVPWAVGAGGSLIMLGVFGGQILGR